MLAKLNSQLAQGYYINPLIFLQLFKRFPLILSNWLRSNWIMASNCLKYDNNHINLMLSFKWKKMTIWAHSETKKRASCEAKHAVKLKKRVSCEAKPTTELLDLLWRWHWAFNWAIQSFIKLINDPTAELLIACYEANTVLAVKLGLASLGFFRRQYLAHCLLHWISGV